MNITIGLHVDAQTKAHVNQYFEAASPFVTVELEAVGHTVSVFLHGAAEAEILGLEFMKAADILREHAHEKEKIEKMIQDHKAKTDCSA